MKWKLSVLVLGLAFGIGFAQAADDQPVVAPPTPSQKAPDWSHYTMVGDVAAMVVKADEKSVTFRVTWNVTVQAKGKRSRGKPRLNGNNRNFNNPFSMRRNNSRTQTKQEHHDYQLEFVPESLVRFKHLPPKFDIDGKKASHTQREMDQLKQPYTVPGYVASYADLTPGTWIEVYVIRDKSIKAENVQENDLRVKYAIILGQDPNPPKDIASPSKAPPKKN